MMSWKPIMTSLGSLLPLEEADTYFLHDITSIRLWWEKFCIFLLLAMIFLVLLED